VVGSLEGGRVFSGMKSGIGYKGVRWLMNRHAVRGA
jgi:hypothetical protein